MRANHKQLINLPVYTEDNAMVGHVVGFEFDIENHLIVKYYIARNKLVNDLLSNIIGDSALQVSSQQVVSITLEKMTIKSTAIPAEEEWTEEEIKKVKAATSAGIHQSSNFSG